MSTARYSSDGVKIPDRCRFCDSENMNAGSTWTGVNQHSHDGNKATAKYCDDCGGMQIVYAIGNKRSTTRQVERTTGTEWRIPAGYSLIVCPESGEMLRVCDHSDPTDANFAAYCATVGRKTPCGVDAVVVQGSYEQDAKGRPVAGVPERGVN